MNDPNLIPNPIPNPIPIPNNVPRSPYNEALISIYNYTTGGEHNKVSQMVNVASVIKGIRTGALIGEIVPDHIPTVLEALTKAGVEAKSFYYSKERRNENKPLIILANTENPNIPYLMNELLPESPPNLTNRANNEKRNSQDMVIGQILGYFTPISIWTHRGKPAGHVSIVVNVIKGKKTYPITLFEHKVLRVNKTMEDKLKEMVEKLKTIELPLEYSIYEVISILRKPPPPESPPAKMSGGSRRRRTRRKKSQRKRSQRR
jgi:hypothetical protein